MYLYKKFYNKNNAKYILFAVSSLIFIGAIGLVIDIGKITLIIYNFACTTGLCIFDAIYNTQKGDLIIVFKGLLAIIAILVLIYSRIIANIERENRVNEE